MPAGWEEKPDGAFTIIKTKVPSKKDRKMKASADQPLFDQPRGHETILFVEDEESLRTVVADFLSQLGYRILAAAHGKEALDLAKSYSGDIDLLLTDVIMPGMSGPQLADQLLQARPKTKVVYVSGYAEPILEPHGVIKSGTILLQ